MSRKKAREIAFRYIYALGYGEGEFCDSESVSDGEAVEDEFIDKLCSVAKENIDAIDAEIRLALKNFSFQRLVKVDLALLRMGIAEIIYMLDTPSIVVIDSVVELAKKYSTDKSPSFINGVLGTVAKKQGE
ncbi:MAG: transcription antitermination factor NusB [Firmicutes bacterium]|nr:transcription antitermination factor NusB [Bacillota bacterium]